MNRLKIAEHNQKSKRFLVNDDGVFYQDFSGRKRFIFPWLEVQIWPYHTTYTNCFFTSKAVIHYYIKDDDGRSIECSGALNCDSPKRIAQILIWGRTDSGFTVSGYQKKRLSEFIAYELEKRTLANKEAFLRRGYPIKFNTY